RSATAAAAPNLANLQHWDQAFVSQVRIQNPPSSLQICGTIESVKVAGNGRLLPHFFGWAFYGASRQLSFLSFYRQEAAAHRSDLSLDTAGEAPARLAPGQAQV